MASQISISDVAWWTSMAAPLNGKAASAVLIAGIRDICAFDVIASLKSCRGEASAVINRAQTFRRVTGVGSLFRIQRTRLIGVIGWVAASRLDGTQT